MLKMKNQWRFIFFAKAEAGAGRAGAFAAGKINRRAARFSFQNPVCPVR
jgi:hypothetical protein